MPAKADVGTGLTDRQETFAREYVTNGRIGCDAYLTAFGIKNRKTAMERASRLLAGGKMQARITDLSEAIKVAAVSTAGVDKAWVMDRLVKVVERSMQAEPVLDRGGSQTGKYQFSASGANQGLRLLGLELGMFVERREVRTGKLGQLSPEDKLKAIEALEAAITQRKGAIEKAQKSAKAKA